MAMTDRWADKQKKNQIKGGGGICPPAPPPPPPVAPCLISAPSKELRPSSFIIYQNYYKACMKELWKVLWSQLIFFLLLSKPFKVCFPQSTVLPCSYIYFANKRNTIISWFKASDLFFLLRDQTYTAKPRPEAHMDLILFKCFWIISTWFHKIR